MRHIIEHWRDGEKIEQFEIAQIVPRPDGSVHIVIPLGGITLGSFDELRFNFDDLVETLLTAEKT